MQSLSSQDSCSSKEILTCSTDRHDNSPEHCSGAFKAQTQFYLSPEEHRFQCTFETRGQEYHCCGSKPSVRDHTSKKAEV